MISRVVLEKMDKNELSLTANIEYANALLVKLDSNFSNDFWSAICK